MSQQQQQQGATVSFFSNLPEVSGLTIAVVGSGCAILIVCLLLVLVFFCCRRRRGAKSSGGSDSDQFSHRDSSSVERKVMSYMQYNNHDGCDDLQHQQAKCSLHHQQQQQQQQYAMMVSPHPSLTSTDETSVDHGSSKVFATLVSGNNPATSVTVAHNNSGSDSDHSGSLAQATTRHQRKIIYEVVV